MLERDLERYLVRRCKEAGILCYKFTSPQRRSVPDRILISRGTVVFVELKAPGKKLTPAQERELKRLENAEVLALMVNNTVGIECLIRTLTS